MEIELRDVQGIPVGYYDVHALDFLSAGVFGGRAAVREPPYLAAAQGGFNLFGSLALESQKPERILRAVAVLKSPHLAAEPRHWIPHRGGDGRNRRAGRLPFEPRVSPEHGAPPPLHRNHHELAAEPIPSGNFHGPVRPFGEPRELPHGHAVDIRHAEHSDIALKLGVEPRAVDFQAAERIGPVEDDDGFPVFKARLHRAEHTACVGVRPRPDVLQIYDEGVDFFEHLGRRLAVLAVERVHRQPRAAVYFVENRHVRLLVAVNSVLRSEQRDELYVFCAPQDVYGARPKPVDARGVGEQPHALARYRRKIARLEHVYSEHHFRSLRRRRMESPKRGEERRKNANKGGKPLFDKVKIGHIGKIFRSAQFPIPRGAPLQARTLPPAAHRAENPCRKRANCGAMSHAVTLLPRPAAMRPPDFLHLNILYIK